VTIDNPDVIDLIAHDPKSDVVSFVLVEYRAWGTGGEYLPELQNKLNTYLAYAKDGQFAEEYPQYSGKALAFDLRTAHPLGEREIAFLEIVRRKELVPLGIGFSWQRYEFSPDPPSDLEATE
jgi:hypothetical protein